MAENTIPVSCVNADLAPVFTWGYPGPAVMDRASRIAARRNFDPADAEKALSIWLAETLELRLDEGFFAGGIPAGAQEGFSAALLPAPAGKEGDYLDARAVLRGKAVSRTTLLRQCGKILSLLPLPDWLTVEALPLTRSVTFCRITPEFSGGELRIDCSGRQGFAAQIPLSLRLCVVPPEPELAS